MPKGPKGDKRPADVNGNAVHVMRIATGEIEVGARPTTARTRRPLRWARRAGQLERRSCHQRLGPKLPGGRRLSGGGNRQAA